MSASAPAKELVQAYRKAASRISPRLSPAALAEVHDDLERAVTGAPASAFSVPQSPRRDCFALKGGVRDDPGAVVRSIGTSRRVFLIQPSLKPAEIDGLAYRVRVLASNDGINSVVVANPLEDAECRGDLSENATVLPSYMEEGEVNTSLKHYKGGPAADRKRRLLAGLQHEKFGDALGLRPYVSSGYDAREIHALGLHRDASRLERELLAPLASLSRAVRGSYDVTINSSASKVPLISVPNGLVTDAGYSFLMGSYVLATHSTAFRVLNPLRGLAFDPIGLSYLLPRVGREFNQPVASSNHSAACACLLALAGYEAKAADMVATGLATHYIGSPYKLNLLERALSDLNSFENQALHPPPKTFYGHEPNTKDDINNRYRNVMVANLIQNVSEYDAAGANEYGRYLGDELDEETGLFLKEKDPTLSMADERIQMYGELDSDLVNWSATFKEVFEEPTVAGMMERLREIAATRAEFEGRADCEEHVLVAEQAQALVAQMERRSPLALCVTLRLMQEGMEGNETLESCMEREKTSQRRLFSKEDGDYARWARSGRGVGLAEMPVGDSFVMRETEDVFSGWAHTRVEEVTSDEVSEIVGA